MDARTLHRHLESSGLRLSVVAGGIRVEPASRLTTETRQLIRANRAALIEAIRQTERLLALVDRVAVHYKATDEELAEIRRIALEDPDRAWASFPLTAKAEGIQ